MKKEDKEYDDALVKEGKMTRDAADEEIFKIVRQEGDFDFYGCDGGRKRRELSRFFIIPQTK